MKKLKMIKEIKTDYCINGGGIIFKLDGNKNSTELTLIVNGGYKAKKVK